jgi:hypothetical protein
VPIEKNADNLIVDVLKKDAPAGALSYKFIEDSVKYGYIQVKDSYYVGPDPDDPRPVGAGTAAKGTRTMFTAEEDAILAKWVLARGGVSSGNVIYQDLAKQV